MFLPLYAVNLMVQCVYECDDIVQNIETVRNLFNAKVINVRHHVFASHSPFDYYFIGYCIKHIGGRWSIAIAEEEVYFLMLALCIGSGGYKGKVQGLEILSISLLTFYPLLELFHSDLCYLGLSANKFSEVTKLQEYISPGSGIRRVKLSSLYNESVLGVVFSPSSLESLELHLDELMINDTINTETVNLLSNNSNLKELKISCKSFVEVNLFIQIASSLQRNTSLSHLLLYYGYYFRADHSLCLVVPTLIKLLQYNHTLQELTLVAGYTYSNLNEEDFEAMVQLVKIAANSTSLKKLSCDSKLFSQVKARITEQYRDFLYELDDNWHAF